MRILHISALPVWSMGGKGGMPSLRETLRGHCRAGYEIRLILPQYDLFSDKLTRLEAPADTDFEVVVAPCSWFPAIAGLRGLVRRLTGKAELPWAVRWLLNVTTWLLLTGSLALAAVRIRYRRKWRFDLVYAHNQYAVLAGYLLRLTLGTPNVSRLYGTFLADLMRKPLVALRYPVAAGGFLVPHRLLICTNDGTRGDEVARRLQVNPERFRFWQNGVDRLPAPAGYTRASFLQDAPPNLRERSMWVLSCSRLSNWKRVDRILRAVQVCRHAGVDCQLLVAGDGDSREWLQRLAGELGVESDVVWLGPVAHADVWSLMAVADVFAIANDVTNRCNPLYEAICAGMPIVSVRDPSTADLLTDGENALLADRDDGAELGKCLIRLCTDSALASRMRVAQQRRSVAFWTWRERMEAEVKEIEALWRYC